MYRVDNLLNVDKEGVQTSRNIVDVISVTPLRTPSIRFVTPTTPKPSPPTSGVTTAIPPPPPPRLPSYPTERPPAAASLTFRYPLKHVDDIDLDVLFLSGFFSQLSWI